MAQSSHGGVTFTQVGATNITSWGSNLYVGLALTAHNTNNQVATADFDQVSVVPDPVLSLTSMTLRVVRSIGLYGVSMKVVAPSP